MYSVHSVYSNTAVVLLGDVSGQFVLATFQWMITATIKQSYYLGMFLEQPGAETHSCDILNRMGGG